MIQVSDCILMCLMVLKMTSGLEFIVTHLQNEKSSTCAQNQAKESKPKQIYR